MQVEKLIVALKKEYPRFRRAGRKATVRIGERADQDVGDLQQLAFVAAHLLNPLDAPAVKVIKAVRQDLVQLSALRSTACVLYVEIDVITVRRAEDRGAAW